MRFVCFKDVSSVRYLGKLSLYQDIDKNMNHDCLHLKENEFYKVILILLRYVVIRYCYTYLESAVSNIGFILSCQKIFSIILDAALSDRCI